MPSDSAMGKQSRATTLLVLKKIVRPSTSYKLEIAACFGSVASERSRQIAGPAGLVRYGAEW